MAEESLKKVTARNVTDGPKVLNAKPAITLQAGEATDGEVLISVAELENAELAEWFEFGVKANSEPEVKPAAKPKAEKPEVSE